MFSPTSFEQASNENIQLRKETGRIVAPAKARINSLVNEAEEHCTAGRRQAKIMVRQREADHAQEFRSTFSGNYSDEHHSTW
jgi:hypothetical protein